MITPEKVRELLEKTPDGPWEIEDDSGSNMLVLSSRKSRMLADFIGEDCKDLLSLCPDVAAAYLEAMERIDRAQKAVRYWRARTLNPPEYREMLLQKVIDAVMEE